MKNLMKCNIMLHFIWVLIVCKSTRLGVSLNTKGYGLNALFVMGKCSDLFIYYSAGPATPYRVSVFPWAVADDSGNQNLDVCSTSTPPNTSFGVQETEDWPTPPTEEEINGSSSDSKPSRTRTNVSPQVPPPPPPPPRSESLTPRNKSLMSPLVPDHYADPYDKLSSTSELAKKIVSDYQEPVNEVIRINTRTQPDNPRLVLRSFSQNEEPDTSLYCKPINKEDICKPATGSEMDGSGTSDSLEGIKSQELYSLPNKPFNPRSSDIEELYSKPVKKRFKQNDDSKAAFTSQSDNQPGNHGNPVTLKKTKTQQSFGLSECNRVQNDNSAVKVSDKVQGNESDVSGHEGIPLGEETESELYSEIMQHFRQKGIVQGEVQKCKPEPIYESIDDCIEKLNSGDEISTEKVSANNAIHEKTESKIQTDEGSGLSRGKKKTVLAASSDKIYETYLSLRGNPNFLKAKEAKGNNMSVLGNTLSKKFKSQPDISFSENCEKSIKVYDNIESHCEELAASNPAINSVNKYAKISNYSGDVNNYVHLTVAQRTQSLENGFKSLECPGTPTITATPSFDSLCTVTPLSKRSESSQSLPAHTGSQENLSYHESNMSVSSRSTLSTVPDEDESRLSETFEDDYATPTAAPPCPTSSFGSADTCPATAGQVSAKPKLIGDDTRQNNTKLDDHAIKEKFANGNIPITPGKISAAKHGIDLSVYILKPVKLDEAGSTVDGQHSSGCSIDSYREAALDSDAKISYETASANKVFEPQTRLAIKENISGSKTKSEIFKSGKKEQERRHTVQTVNEIKVNDQKATQKTGLHASVPSIGLASKVLKAEHNTKPGKSKLKQNFRNENELAFEPDSKRFCVGGTKVMGHGEDLYLETDIDSVIADRGRKNMTKSKSHSSVEHGSSTVVTEIW